ncbi:MAG: hypothetical protein KDD94_10180 [Calditrichaeota bacterium]|nr:hypothetical protein [Calditrichota bacterium]
MYRYLLVVLLIVFLFCQTDRKHIILSYGANFNIPSTDFASDETAFGKRIGFHYWLEKKLTVSIVYNIRSFKTDIDSTVQDFNFEHISLIPSYRLWESRSDFFMISLPLSLSISEEFTVSGKKKFASYRFETIHYSIYIAYGVFTDNFWFNFSYQHSLSDVIIDFPSKIHSIQIDLGLILK